MPELGTRGGWRNCLCLCKVAPQSSTGGSPCSGSGRPLISLGNTVLSLLLSPGRPGLLGNFCFPLPRYSLGRGEERRWELPNSHLYTLPSKVSHPQLGPPCSPCLPSAAGPSFL